jgi:hypothetical protein
MAGEVSALDRALARAGEDIIIRRVVGTLPNTVNIDVNVRALVRSYSPEELVGGITQTDSLVIISPSEIDRAQWPGGQAATMAPFNPDTRLPKKGDKAIIQGRLRNIEVVDPFLVQGELVRIEMRVLG